MFIHHPAAETPEHRKLIVAKNRNGAVGDVPMYFSFDKLLFWEEEWKQAQEELRKEE